MTRVRTCSLKVFDQFRRTHVFYENLASGNYGGLIDETSLAVLESLFRGRIIDSDAIEVSKLGFLCNEDLESFNSGIRVDLNRLWEVLDRLPWS